MAGQFKISLLLKRNGLREIQKLNILQDIVEDLENHLIQVHELDEPTAVAVTQDRPLQIILDPIQPQVVGPLNRSYPINPLSKPSPGPSRKNQVVSLHCNICAKDFASQRDFTNHRRRKGFCRPLYPTPPTREEPKQIRRIGIIRKLIKK